MTAPDHTPEQFTSLLHARGHPYMGVLAPLRIDQNFASGSVENDIGPPELPTA